MAVDLDEYLAALKASGLTPAQQARERQVFFDTVIAASPEYRGLPSTERQALWKEVVGGTTPPDLGAPAGPGFLGRTREALKGLETEAKPGFSWQDMLTVLRDPKASASDKLAAAAAMAGEHGPRQAASLGAMPVDIGGAKTALFAPGGSLWGVPMGLGQDIARGMGAAPGGMGETAGGLAGLIGPVLARNALMAALRGGARHLAAPSTYPTFSSWASRFRGTPATTPPGVP